MRIRHSSDSLQQGYIALLGTIIITTAGTAIALVLLLAAADNQRSVLVSQQSSQARALATLCAEQALQLIRDDTSYTGTDTLTHGAGTCTYTVTSTGASTRSVTATGDVKNTVGKLSISVTIGASTISISSWQEVSEI